MYCKLHTYMPGLFCHTSSIICCWWQRDAYLQEPRRISHIRYGIRCTDVSYGQPSSHDVETRSTFCPHCKQYIPTTIPSARTACTEACHSRSVRHCTSLSCRSFRKCHTRILRRPPAGRTPHSVKTPPRSMSRCVAYCTQHICEWFHCCDQYSRGKRCTDAQIRVPDIHWGCRSLKWALH